MTKELAQIDNIISGRMEQAITGVRQLVADGDVSIVEPLLAWIDMRRWRSTEATSFWVHTYYLLMRFADATHLERLRKQPEHADHSQMHAWVRRNRELVARVVALRVERAEQSIVTHKLPRTRAKQMAYVAERLGNPSWDQCDDIVDFMLAPRFKLDGEEGLHLYAALLLHGNAASLQGLQSLVAGNPIIGSILAAHGAQKPTDDSGQVLLAAVTNDPADDAARLVYADWLSEQDDPRGAFIVAQMQPQSEPTEELPSDLSIQSAVQWAGGVGGQLRYTAPFVNERPRFTPRYRRGFLSGCLVNSLEGPGSESPDWSTIEVLDVLAGIDRIAEYNLSSLQVLGGLEGKKMAALWKWPLVTQLRGIGIQLDGLSGPEQVTLMDRLLSLPKLHLLTIADPNPDIFEHPLFQRITLLASCQTGNIKTIGLSWRARWLEHYEELLGSGEIACELTVS